MKTYNETYLAARRTLREAGIEAYDIEARILCAYAADKTVEKFLQDSRLYVTDIEFEKKLSDCIQRRTCGEPVAYITGEWEFYGLPFRVSPDTLIPRPDTEVLVSSAIDILHTTQRPTRALDLCTGSGAIGIAIASHVPTSRVVLADISPLALEIARSNIKRHNITRMVTCVEADATQPAPALLGRFDILVSNPPYIRTKDIENLDRSVKDYEPHLALDGGEDGLDFYRSIVQNWSAVLMTGGYILFEVGYDQSASVQKILRKAGFENIIARQDAAGTERVIIARKTK